MTDFIEMAQRHKDTDQLARGSFEWAGTACSVGCFNHDLGQKPGDFAALAKSTGYPEWAHRLQEAVFEGLPNGDGADWHVDFFTAAANVTDWTRVYHQTMIAILTVALPYDKSAESVVQMVIDLHIRAPDVSRKEWNAAAVAAARTAERAAAGAAAVAARAAAVATAARGAAMATAARGAAMAAAEAAGATARAAAYRNVASGFIEACKERDK